MSKLVLAIGGGGDVVTAAVLARKLGAEVGLLSWERFVVDPEPGPLVRSNFKEVEGDGPLFVITGRSQAYRGGRVFKHQGVCVVEALGASIYAISPDYPPSKVNKALAMKFDEIIGVDVGGDVLGCGCEADLRSPLADAYGLAALKRAEEAGAYVEVVVVALGADGELPREYLLQRASLLASRGAFLGYYAVEPRDSPLLQRLVERCVTEASAMALRALRGEHGYRELRGGVAKAYVDLYTPVALRFSVGLEINQIWRDISRRLGYLHRG